MYFDQNKIQKKNRTNEEILKAEQKNTYWKGSKARPKTHGM